MNEEERRGTWLGALAEPRRAALYEYVVGQAGRAVGRDEAADATGLKRALAAFHLDQLASAGLLEVEFKRLSGRSGPGAGRPAKTYRAATQEVSLTVPERRYLLAARMLLEALTDDAHALERMRPVAERHGFALGTAAAADTPAPAEDTLRLLLKRLGYAPREQADRSMSLANCPFQELADQNRELTCRTNLAFLSGLVRGLGTLQVVPQLNPKPGSCCVRFAAE